MNILLLNHYAGSPSHGMEFRPFYMAREWVNLGHGVKVIAASYSHVRSRQPAVKGRMLDEDISGVSYRWYTTPEYRGNGLGRVRNILTFVWALWRDASRIAAEFRPDAVIASSTYPMDIWAADRIAKLAGAKLVYEVHDLWPLSPIELGGMSRRNPFIMWVQAAEDYAYRHASKVVSMLPNAKGYMSSRGMAEDKFVYVPNGVNEADWTESVELPPDTVKAIAELRETGLPIVCYAGAHGLANALDVLLDASIELKNKAQILLVGNGPERDRLKQRAEREELSNVFFLPAVQKNAMPRLLAMVDVAYLGLLPQPLFKYGISPNKLMDYMMAGKPIVMSVDAGNDPVAEAGCGFTVKPGDATAVSEAIVHLVDMPIAQREAMGRRGRTEILKKQTYRVLAQDVLAALDFENSETRD
jgi:glycosyltransferase involved in cell wall biosynthesis